MTIKTNSRPLSALEGNEPFDVCIIGSGFAGTILGRSLAQRGCRTVILESGGSLLRWLVDPRLKELAAYETSGDTNYPTTRTKARAIGGNSNFWTGRAERLHPLDFENNSYTPKGGGWPLTYAEIEPYYQQAENTLRVRGGTLSQYHAPRQDGLPLPASSNISNLKALMEDAEVTVDDSPTATPRKTWRGFKMSKEILPDFLASPNALLLTGLTVTRLIPDSDGNIVGAEAHTQDGQSKTVLARVYVVACGGIESPRLLMLSRSETFPKGIGNNNDQVGRGFNEHPGVNFYGKIPQRRSSILPSYKLGRSHQHYDQFKHEGLGAVLPVFIQSWMFPNHLMSLIEIPKDMLRMLTRIGSTALYIGASIEMEPCDQNRVTLSDNLKDRLGNPVANLSFNFTEADRKTLDGARELIISMFHKLGTDDVREAELTWSRHHIGTCRMGDNRRSSVVDRNLRVHDSPNLYIGGCETFVTGGAVPPVLTITALTYRLADHLVDQLKSNGEIGQSKAPIRTAGRH